jgi:hypothetical protein
MEIPVKSAALHLNRRAWLQGVLALATPTGLVAGPAKGAREEQALENTNLDFRFVARQGKVTSRRFTNKLANETVDLPDADFGLEFDGGGVADPSQFSAKVTPKGKEGIELLYSGAAAAVADLQVRVEYTLPPSQHYLRKQISVRQRAQGATRRLTRADLDLWKGVGRSWKSATADRMPYGSHPIFCDTLWAGVEFVAAFNNYSREGFVLRSRPGGKTLTSDWWKLHSTVTGVAAPGGAKAAFFRYLEDVREAPPRLVACYNTWWSLPEIFDQKEWLALVQAVIKGLYEKHGVFFDFVTADMGWSKPRSVWAVDEANFPRGLSPLVETVKAAGGRLGLWMSPSNVYHPVIDYEWAKQEGYTVVDAGRRQGISLADPQYLDAVKNQLRQLIVEYQLGQIKYDGFIARETAGHDHLLPGEDSVEPLAQCSLELIKASKEANPKLFTEPTYLNSQVNYVSPWMIQYADSVWAGAGSDCPAGIGPAPDYRESQTTSREFFVESALDEVWLPQNAIQSFDIVHCDGAGSFPNHAAMAFGRGRFFISTYLNPKFMTDGDWQIYAGLLKWARRNEGVLKNTVVLPSRVELGEPYAYAHWSGSRGIIAVRNPSNESKKFTLDLTRTAAPPELSQAVCYTQYPYRKGIMEGVTGTAAIALDLAPWELIFLEIVPRAELGEPVAMGARWYRGSDGSMQVASETSSTVRLLLPQGGEQAVTSKPWAAGEPRGEVLSQKLDELPQSDWLGQGGKPLPTASFVWDCKISIPEGAIKGKALLLLEFPGREHLPSNCACQVNGHAVALQASSSTAHVGFYGGGPASAWKRLEPYISNWTWYICDVENGSTVVKFSGAIPYEHCKIGLWAWADWDLTPQSVPISIACPEPAMPQHQDHLKRQGTCVMAPAGPRLPPSTG